MSEEVGTHNPTDGPSVQMPRYRCHKEVWALKIKEVTILESGHVQLRFSDERYASMIEPPEFDAKHKPHPGGYLVVYKGGYRSFSPADVFESGYTLIN